MHLVDELAAESDQRLQRSCKSTILTLNFLENSDISFQNQCSDNTSRSTNPLALMDADNLTTFLNYLRIVALMSYAFADSYFQNVSLRKNFRYGRCPRLGKRAAAAARRSSRPQWAPWNIGTYPTCHCNNRKYVAESACLQSCLQCLQCRHNHIFGLTMLQTLTDQHLFKRIYRWLNQARYDQE